MDKIMECASNYKKLCSISYKFIVSYQRKTREIKLDFRESDFFHLAGLQYLTDLAIPRNRKTILKCIMSECLITDEVLCKSKYFSNKNSGVDIKSRIEELRFLEQYLDTDNMIKIFSVKDDVYLKSKIDAEYIIESKLKNCNTSVYIFLARRSEDTDYYCVKSFFVKDKVIYGGQALYWMYKEKILEGRSRVLYSHKNFQVSNEKDGAI